MYIHALGNGGRGSGIYNAIAWEAIVTLKMPNSVQLHNITLSKKI